MRNWKPGTENEQCKLIVDSLQLVHNLTGYESKEGAGETVGEALRNSLM